MNVVAMLFHEELLRSCLAYAQAIVDMPVDSQGHSSSATVSFMIISAEEVLLLKSSAGL